MVLPDPPQEQKAVLSWDQPEAHLTESVHKVALQKSIPAQIRQPILYISNNQG